MRYRQLCWMILGIVFLVENGQIEDVYGMPLDLSSRPDGSKLCFDLGIAPGPWKQNRSYIAYEVLFRDKTSFIANTSDCNLEIWNDPNRIEPPGGNKRSFHRIEARLKIEDKGLYKIYVDEKDQPWFTASVNSIIQIMCSNRKFKSCIRFQEGISPMQRRLLSVEQLYMYREPNDDIPLQPIILLVAGVVILVIAGSLCADCNKNQQDALSVSETRPKMLSYHERSPSLSKSAPQEQKLQEEIVFETKDDRLMETAEKNEGDSVDANNHVVLYNEPAVSVQHVSSQSVQSSDKHMSSSEQQVPSSEQHVPSSVQQVPSSTQHVPTSTQQSSEQRLSSSDKHVSSSEQHVPSSEQHVPSSEQQVPSSTQHVPTSTQHVQISEQCVSSSTQHVPTSTQHVQNSAQHVPPKSVEHVNEGDHKGEKKKRGSKHDKHEHEHEEHRAKFWKRSRSAKKSASSSDDHRTSDGGFKDEEHKHKERLSAKETKGKKRKSKDRSGSTGSEEKKALDDDHSERPRETTPMLERHSRGLPAPPPPPSSPGHTLPAHPPLPGPPGHALRARPIPQRQISAPDGTRLEEDDNYEAVEMRKTKSVENVDITADDNYDTVRVEVGKPRPAPTAYDSIIVDRPSGWRGSDIYEVVDDASQPVEDLYDEVEDAKKKVNEKKEPKCDDKFDEDEVPEDPYSKIKKPKEQEVLENTELYEEVDKVQENAVKSHDYSDVKKKLLDVKDAESIRSRSQSDTASLQRPGNEYIKRCHTIDVVREREGAVTSTEGAVTNTSLDYLYAKVDLSKKTKRLHSTEGDTETSGEGWSDDNPPPLPPVYVSSKQIQNEMGRTEGTPDSLYDEVGPSTGDQDRPPNMELSVPDNNTEETKRLSSVSDDYELVEVKHVVTTVDGDYSGLVDEGPRPKSDSHSHAGPAHVETGSAPADTPVVVSSSNGIGEGEDEDDAPHYEIVTPRTTVKDVSKTSNVGWV